MIWLRLCRAVFSALFLDRHSLGDVCCGYYYLTFAPLREIFLRLLMIALNKRFCRAEPLGLA